MNFIFEAIVTIGYALAIIMALCFIFAAIASYIITKDDKEYDEAIKELEEGEINESDSE